MGRRAVVIMCGAEDREELERLSRSHTEPWQRVERARIVLACLLGEGNDAIAKRLKTRSTTVSKWRGRFAREGMAGLEDAPRRGRPKIYPELRRDVLAALETPPPKGQAAWDGKALAE